MSEPANNPGPEPVPPTVEALQREIEELRWHLARKTREADVHRAAAYDWLRDRTGYTPLTEDEVLALLAGPRGEGESLRDILEEYERRVGG